MSDGNIYSNLNEKAIGNIKNMDLSKAIYKEISVGKGWWKTRANVVPCKNCLYKFICPPISNYEYAIGRYNLCKIN